MLVYTNLFKLVCETSSFADVNQTRIRCCNQPVLSNGGQMSCSMKQREPLIGFELTTNRLRVSRSTHTDTPPLIIVLVFSFMKKGRIDILLVAFLSHII